MQGGVTVPRPLGVLLLCAMIITVSVCIASARQEQPLLADRMDRPPVPVSVGFTLVDVLDIDGVTQSMTVDFSVHLSWKDESLAGRWPDTRVLDLGEVWVPDIQLLNNLGLAQTRRDVVEVEPDGTVTWRRRYYGDVSASMYLKDFPADSHTLNIRFVSAIPGEVVFAPNDDRIIQRDVLSVVDWAVGEGQLVMEDIDIGYATLHGFTYRFSATRFGGYYLWRVIFPLAMIAFMSFTVFWIDPTEIEAQLGVASGAMLTVVAFLFSLSSLSPKVPYQTRLDRYTFLAIVLIFMSLIEAVVSSRLAAKGRPDTARRFDLACRVLFPGVFVVTTLVLFLA